MKRLLILLALVPSLLTAGKSAGWAMLGSALFPGGGQFYTQNYLKGALIGTTQATLEYFTIRDHLRAMDYLKKGDTANYYRCRNSRNNLLWWTASVWVFSIADAYVSAHMFHFKQDERLNLYLSPMRIGLAATW